MSRFLKQPNRVETNLIEPRIPTVIRVVGFVAIVGVGLTVWLGLWVTPPDKFMGNLVRLIYLHPPVAWVAFLAFGVTALASALYLWKRTRSMLWDRIAGASGEVGVVFTGLTLVSGSIWGRPTWGVWWTWDPLLTTTALLFLLYIGYLVLRNSIVDPTLRAKRSAIAALVAVVDVPIVHFSVLWWRSLHQPPTVLNPTLSPEIHGQMAWTLLLGFVSFTLVYVWMAWVRYETIRAQDYLASVWLDNALQERRDEAYVSK
jgi:heme exporter protein C